MKQLLFIFRKYHVLLVGLLLSTTIHAQDVEVNGICYNVDLESMQATVVAGDYAFKDINIPEQFTYGGRVFTVTTIGEKAFYCDNPQTASNSPAFATSIIIPHSVKKIENHAFAGTKYLKKFALPNSIDYIDAINSFTASDSIIIEDGVTDLEIPYHKNFKMGKFWTTYLYIGRDIISKFYGAVTWDYTFWGLAGCHDIETIEYGDNVSKPLSLTYDAGSNFIYGMNNLKTVIFGKNIEGMFEGRNVPSLTTIVSHNSVPRGYSDTSSGLFTNSQYLNIKIKVPKGSKEKYLNTEGWKKFLNIEEFDDTHIGPIVNPEVSTDDCLTVNNVTSCKGKTISISINLINKTANLTAYQFDLTLPTGILLATNDKGKYHLHSNDSDPLEDTYYAYNVNTYNPNEFKCDCTIYSYDSSTQVWKDNYYENDYFFPVFALMGFPYRDFHYDRFTYNKDEHKYTCPIAVMTEGDSQTEIRDITLMFENNVLIYSELTIVVVPGEDPEHPEGTMAYTTNFTDIGTTTVTFPTNN